MLQIISTSLMQTVDSKVITLHHIKIPGKITTKDSQAHI